MKIIIPSYISRTARILGLTFFILFALRIIMLCLVWNDVNMLAPFDIIKAMYIGGKFDMRIAVFTCLPIALFLAIPWFEHRLERFQSLLFAWYVLAMVGLAVVYAFDFGFFFYLGQRIDSTFFELLPDAGLSFSMVWQTYPVLRIALVLCALTFCFHWLIRRMLRGYLSSGTMRIRTRAGWTLIGAFTLFLLGYAQVSSNLFPLRWSNAYFSPNQHLVTLALNPVQNLYDSYKSIRSVMPDMAAVRDAYPRMAARLGVAEPDEESLNFWRIFPGKDIKRPNIVIILMESLGMPRTSLASGLFRPGYVSEDPSETDPTPNLRELQPRSLYFPWFVSPTRTTSRAVFTTVTGVPDINRSGGTSSRNPLLVDQFSIISEFRGYDITYMIGGSASWANIRGILTHNVPGLKLMEEGAWKAPNVDVWGISDLALLRESIDYYDTVDGPFFSFIQTAGFHRPWTIPSDNAGFTPRNVSNEVIRYYGFENVDEYNSMYFSDHALGEFFRNAREKPWFDNTIFVIMGDHGLTMRSGNVPESYLRCSLQGYHVPLLIYAPGLPETVSPGIIEIPCGQPDVLPTVAELAGIPYRNHTLGRNLLDPKRIQAASEGKEWLYIGAAGEKWQRFVQGGYCFYDQGTQALYLLDGNGENLLEQEPERAASMKQAADDVFHTSKYLLFNNKKADIPPLP